ncbi:hypothetical protein [Micromonospora aurantiaca (nom. illeg.)]|uniref:hypothetical protein n=1 Tax=Micromonospora aurantiaca (nom. illeg.) TaxID=47850 RepID=UPI0033D93521
MEAVETAVQRRHRRLRHRLPTGTANLPADPQWLLDRVLTYAEAAKVPVTVILDAQAYTARTGVPVTPLTAGDCYTGPPGDRAAVRVIYLSPVLLPTRGVAECVIAHEIMHARWPSYGHRPIAFQRAQELLDHVGAVAQLTVAA